ncbi:T9SS type A sorting domain-containing protein [Epilithonimonas xixisoli]|nr:T9SS type A sorting domain-containing protein [Epilithonimonas xixisoli]
MNKKLILFTIMLFGFITIEAQSILNVYPIFKKRHESATTAYCVNNGGSCSGNPAFEGANLGTFVSGGNILRLAGIQSVVNRCAGQTVTAVTAHFRSYLTASGPGSLGFTAAALAKGTTTPNGCGGTNEPWNAAYSGDGTSLATGFATPGAYTLEMYYSITTSTGTILLNNAGANYKASFIITADTTWNGTAWNYGKPALQSNAIFAGNFNMSGESLSVNNITVNSGVTVSLQSERSLKINGNVVNNGTIIVNNDATYLLVDGSTSTGTGKVIVRREANLRKDDYTYWSSPVSGQNLYNFSVGTPTNRFYLYNEANDRFHSTGLNAASTFSPGVGYAIKGKDTYSPTSPATEIFTFEGKDHNGNITVNLNRTAGDDKGYNLIGNPYPSNINFQNLFNYGTNRTSIFNKQWFWTTLNEVVTQQGSNYAGNNYATFVAGVGGVGPSYVSGNIEEPSLRPLGFTKVGQGFLVQARYNNALLTFNNSIRSSNTVDSIFFNKSANKEGDDEDEDDEEPQPTIDRFWLKFVNPKNIANTILVAHIPYATNGYDEDYEVNLFSLGDDAFFSVVDPYKFQIQARSLPVMNSDSFALGYVSSEAGEAIIALDDKEGVFKTESKAIYLKDSQTGTVTNLQEGYYTFNTAKQFNDTRFSIMYENNVLSTNTTKAQEVSVYKQNNELVAKSNVNISNVEVFDVSGRMIKNAVGNNTKEIRINTVGLNKGVYILKITTAKGITTKKVII